MFPQKAGRKNWIVWKSLTIAGLGLALGVGGRPVAAQQNQPDQQNQVQSNGAPSDQQAEGQGQPDDSRLQEQQQPDAQPQGQQDPQPQGQMQGQMQEPAPNQQAVPPQTLTLPAGTVIRVRTDEWISTDRNVIGDNFSGALDQPIVVNGWVVARRGQAQTGHVSLVKKGHGGGASELGVDLPELTLVDGQQLPLQTQLFQTSGGTNHGQDAAIIGSTTGFGALIGAIAGRGTGAAIGAGVGATAGIIGVMSTQGRPTVISPETVLSFKLQAPVTISTDKSQFAFQPVTQQDYDSRGQQNRPRMVRPGPPPAPYYGPYAYPYAYGYGYPYPYGYYPGPYVGFGYYGRFGGYRRW
jgi:hypothetical protein